MDVSCYLFDFVYLDNWNANFKIFLLSGAEEHFYIIFVLGYTR